MRKPSAPRGRSAGGCCPHLLSKFARSGNIRSDRSRASCNLISGLDFLHCPALAMIWAWNAPLYSWARATRSSDWQFLETTLGARGDRGGTGSERKQRSPLFLELCRLCEQLENQPIATTTNPCKLKWMPLKSPMIRGRTTRSSGWPPRPRMRRCGVPTGRWRLPCTPTRPRTRTGDRTLQSSSASSKRPMRCVVKKGGGLGGGGVNRH